MADPAVPMIDQLRCAERELKMRQRAYPRWIAANRMTASQAASETRAMEAIVETLRKLAEGERLI